MWLDAIVTNYVKGDAQRIYLGFAGPTVAGWHATWSGESRSLTEALTSPALRAILGASGWTAVQWFPFYLAYRTALGKSWSLSKKTRIWRRYALPDAVVRAVIACADVKKSSFFKRPQAIHHLADQLATVERAVLQAHRSSGQVPFGSHGRQNLKGHAQTVVSQLRRMESRVHSEGDVALAPLASCLIKIGSRSIEGRVGCLLDEQDFETGLTPVRDWEPLRLAAAAVLIAGCAVGVSLLSLPDGVTTYVIGGCGVAIVALIYGRRVHNVLGLLDTIRGA
ncbi:hypothetical protein [Streptomyces werraensis]|uniref:hypothetical protein n=1 Tax=Streptomyces werraensis TaxID=68284 RepID=UPI001CE31A9E